VLDALDGRIDLLIDSGPTRYGKDSTIVDFSAEPWRIVRQGVYDARTLRKMMRSLYLFVCTGNTCRSPIAMGLARKILAGKLGVKPGELAKRGVEVVSAGLFAADGAKVSPEAVEATAELGGDISRHRSRKLTMELINSADLIFCMTQAHVDQVLELAPQAAGKVQRLDDAGDIPDPIGGGVGTYHRTAKRIENALQRRLEGLP
jgi:protein-tyrosine phosphatase